MKHIEVAKIIIRLKNDDLELRNKLIETKQLSNGYNEEMAKLHNKNAEALSDLIDAVGFPTIDKVGKEASEAAWLIIQHSIGQPDFMRKCVELLKKAVSKNQANPLNLAYLTDRVAVFEDNCQLYGTQFDWDENGELSPNPYDDIIKVNQRRKSIGLNSVEKQTQIMRSRAKSENVEPPSDYLKRKKEMNKWKKSVGWIK